MTTKVRSAIGGLPIAVTPRSGIARTRTVRRILGFGPILQWGVHNNNLANLTRGLVERVFRVNTPQGLQPPPQPAPGYFASSMSGAFKAVTRYLGQAAPVDYDQFVEYYRGRRRTIYRAAADSLLHIPVRRADAKLKTFVKAEKVNFSSKPDPAPRVIQPRDPRYNVAVGRYLRPVEKRVYQAVGKAWGGRTILKGLNARDTAMAMRRMWDQFDQPVALGLDASRFDQHVSAEALRWEHGVYLSMFRGDARNELRELLSWQIHNAGVAFLPEAKVKYSVEGCRMSGDMNTSTGNCLLMSMMVYQWALNIGVRCRLANNGDDCVVIMEARDLPTFTSGLNEQFTRWGFTLTSEPPTRVFEEIEFCQCHPVFDGEEWLMVRNFNTSVSKDLVTLLDVESSFGKWASAIGECGLSLTGGLPVLQDFYHCLKQCGHGRYRGEVEGVYFGEGLRMMSSGMERGLRPITAAARVSFALAFGILPDEQEQLEAWLQRHQLPRKMNIVADLPSVWYK